MRMNDLNSFIFGNYKQPTPHSDLSAYLYIFIQLENIFSWIAFLKLRGN